MKKSTQEHWIVANYTRQPDDDTSSDDDDDNVEKPEEITVPPTKKRKLDTSLSIYDERRSANDIAEENVQLRFKIELLKTQIKELSDSNTISDLHERLDKMSYNAVQFAKQFVRELREEFDRNNKESQENMALVLKQVVSEKEFENKQLENSMSICVAENYAEVEQIRLLKEQLDQQRREIDNMQELGRLKEENDQLLDKHNELQKVLDEQELKKNELELDIQLKDEKIGNLLVQTEELDRLRESIREYEREKERLQEERDKANRLNESLEEKIRLKNENDEKVRKHEEEEKNRRFNQLEERNASIQEKLGKLKNSLKEKERAYNTLSSDNVHYQNEVKKLQGLLKDFQVREKKERARGSLELTVYQDEASSSKKELLRLKKQLKQMSHTKEISDSNIKEATKINNDLKEQLENEREAKKKVNEENEKLVSKVDNLENTILTLTTDNSVKEKALNLRKRDIEEYEEEKRELEERIEELTKELKTLKEKTQNSIIVRESFDDDEARKKMEEIVSKYNDNVKKMKQVEKEKRDLQVVIFNNKEKSNEELERLKRQLEEEKAFRLKEAKRHEKEVGENNAKKEESERELQKKIDDLQQKNEEYQILIHEEEEEAKDEELKKIRKQLEKLKKSNKEQEEEIQNVKEAKEVLEEENKALNDEKRNMVVLYEEKNSSKDDELKNLREDLKKAQQEAESKEEELRKAQAEADKAERYQSELKKEQNDHKATKSLVIDLEYDSKRKKELEEEKKRLKEELEKERKEKSGINVQHQIVVREKENGKKTIDDLKRQFEEQRKAREEADKKRYEAEKDLKKKSEELQAARIEKLSTVLQLEDTLKTHKTENEKLLEQVQKSKLEVAKLRQELISVPKITPTNNEGLKSELELAKFKIVELEENLKLVKVVQKQPLSISPDLEKAQQSIRNLKNELEAYRNMKIYNIDQKGKAFEYIGKLPNNVSVLLFDLARQKKLYNRWTFWNSFKEAIVYDGDYYPFKPTSKKLKDEKNANDIVIFDIKHVPRMKKTTQNQFKKLPIITIGSNPTISSSMDGLYGLNKSFFTILFDSKKEIGGKYEIHLRFGDSYDVIVKQLHLFVYQDIQFYIIDFHNIPRGRLQKVSGNHGLNTILYKGALKIIIHDKSTYESRTIETNYSISNDFDSDSSFTKTILKSDNIILFTQNIASLLNRLDLIVIMK